VDMDFQSQRDLTRQIPWDEERIFTCLQLQFRALETYWALQPQIPSEELEKTLLSRPSDMVEEDVPTGNANEERICKARRSAVCEICTLCKSHKGLGHSLRGLLGITVN
jgi:hypothetical protein